MQIIFEDEDKRNDGRRTGILGFVTCAGRVSRYLERECNGETRGRGNRI